MNSRPDSDNSSTADERRIRDIDRDNGHNNVRDSARPKPDILTLGDKHAQNLLASLIDASDIAFLVDEHLRVLWYKSDAQLAEHTPAQLGSGHTLSTYLPRQSFHVLSSLVDRTDAPSSLVLALEPTNDDSPVYEARVHTVADDRRLIVLQMLKQTGTTHAPQERLLKRIETMECNFASLSRALRSLDTLSDVQTHLARAALKPFDSAAISLWHSEDGLLHLSASLSKPLSRHQTARPRSHSVALADLNEFLSSPVTQLLPLAQTNSGAADVAWHSMFILDAPAAVRVAKHVSLDTNHLGVLLFECADLQLPVALRRIELKLYVTWLSELYTSKLVELASRQHLAQVVRAQQHLVALDSDPNHVHFIFHEKVLFANAALQQRLNLLEQQIYSHTLRETLGNLAADQLAEAIAKHKHIARAKALEIELELQPFGLARETCWLYLSLYPCNYDGQSAWQALGVDISALKITEARLKYQLNHDALTGLPNRQRLMQRLESNLVRACRDRFHRFTLVTINIDRFKIFNDSMGQLLGDQLLLEISKRIRLALGPADFCARIGTDEFAILIDSPQQPDALAVVDTVEQALSEPFWFNHHETVCSTSIGIVMADQSYDKAEHILRDASIAMYRARQESQRSRCLFDRSMHEHARKLLNIEADLRGAIRDQNLDLYYQPIIDLKLGQIAYFEALLRWQKEDLDMVPPLDFIPLAEESGVILPLGRWVAERACQQLASWRSQGIHSGVSINVSGKQFETGTLVGELKDLRERYLSEIPHLKIEITETSMIQNSTQIKNQMLALKALGFDLLVDDFGTGYSSLSYLNQFPVDSIKIDRSFITNLMLNENSAEIIQAVINLAHSLKLSVVAEGVETEAQACFLKSLGCDFAQGYYFSFPLAPEQAGKLLRTRWPLN